MEQKPDFKDYFSEGRGEDGEKQDSEKIFGPLEFDEKTGRIIKGLPEGLTEKDIRIFIGPDGKKYAANPSEEVLEAEKFWKDDNLNL